MFRAKKKNASSFTSSSRIVIDVISRAHATMAFPKTKVDFDDDDFRAFLLVVWVHIIIISRGVMESFERKMKDMTTLVVCDDGIK